jgi:hypothetical protein
VAESEIGEYTRNLERLDMVLANIEKYIHIAFAAMRNEDVVRRVFTLVGWFVPKPEDITDIVGRVIDDLHQIPARGEQETEPTIYTRAPYH